MATIKKEKINTKANNKPQANKPKVPVKQEVKKEDLKKRKIDFSIGPSWAKLN